MIEDSSTPFVSIIIPCRNESGYIESCIQSIQNNDYPKERIEIIVVDGESTDGTDAIVSRMAREDPRIVLLSNPGRIVPIAMNIGLRACKGDIFIRIDGHAEIPVEFIRESVSCLLEHPDAWVAGGHLKREAAGFVARAIACASESPIAVGNARHHRGDYDGWVDTLAFGAHHRWVPDRIGYFDEELVRNQDDEFNYRVLQGGGKIWLSSSIWSTYYSRSSLKKLWRQYFQYGFFRIRTMQKHRRPATLRQIAPLLFVLAMLLSVVGGLFWRPFWWVLAAQTAIYCCGLLYGVWDVARRANWRYALLSPVVFATLHFGYGIGSLWGVVRFILLRGAGMPRPEAVKLSR